MTHEYLTVLTVQNFRPLYKHNWSNVFIYAIGQMIQGVIHTVKAFYLIYVFINNIYVYVQRVEIFSSYMCTRRGIRKIKIT